MIDDLLQIIEEQADVIMRQSERILSRCRTRSAWLENWTRWIDMAKLDKLYELIDKENFEPGGTLEERVSVLEEVMQKQVMAVSTNEDEGATR